MVWPEQLNSTLSAPKVMQFPPEWLLMSFSSRTRSKVPSSLLVQSAQELQVVDPEPHGQVERSPGRR